MSTLGLSTPVNTTVNAKKNNSVVTPNTVINMPNTTGNSTKTNNTKTNNTKTNNTKTNNTTGNSTKKTNNKGTTNNLNKAAANITTLPPSQNEVNNAAMKTANALTPKPTVGGRRSRKNRKTSRRHKNRKH